MIDGAAGDWWVATFRGVARFRAITDAAELASARPQYYFPTENIFRLFQDRSGNVWISDQHHPANKLTVWNPQTGAFDRFPASSGAPDLANDRVQAYCQDRAGNLWMGLERGGLWRRSRTTFRRFTSAEGAPAGSINWLHADAAGRIWAASSIAGVSRISDPESEYPKFASYTTREALSSNEVLCITEDLAGRIYLCTARGVDRLDPATGRVKRYTGTRPSRRRTADRIP